LEGRSREDKESFGIVVTTQSSSEKAKSKGGKEERERTTTRRGLCTRRRIGLRCNWLPRPPSSLLPFLPTPQSQLLAEEKVSMAAQYLSLSRA